MPILDMSFEQGIFTAREVGTVDGNDARKWAEALHRCTRASATPVVILVDATHATTISAEARRIFAQASETPNVRIAAIACGNLRVTQQSRIAALMGSVRSTHQTHFFNTFEEAEQFANEHAAPAYSG